MKKAVIVSAARTPIGSFNGGLRSLSATRLGSIAIAAALTRAEMKGEEVDEVIMGNVLSAGLGQARARQGRLGLRRPESGGCTAVIKRCGPGRRAVVLAHQAVVSGSAAMVAHGGA